MSKESNPRVLVVDDWSDTADSLAGLLTLWGYDAEACYSGEVALEIARDYLPDVVLLDVAMPGIDGFQVVHALRKMSDLKETTVIGVTGYTDVACQASVQDTGFDYCLLKPVEIKTFRELIGRIAAPVRARDKPHCGLLTRNGGRTLRRMFA